MHDVDAQLVHDMRNAVAALHLAATDLRDHRGSMSPRTVERTCETLARRSDMLGRLLEDLTTSHLVDRGELSLTLRRVSLADICRDVRSELDGGSCHISLDVRADALVLADPVRVTQVLDNLLTNAVRYGGAAITVSAEHTGTAIRLTVSDDGPGVPALVGERLFEAYARGASSSRLGGSGLGLLIARQLCESMGGSIAYENHHGSRFTVTLPALPTVDHALGHDPSGVGHTVAFWRSETALVERVATFAAHGLTSGEAVVLAATPTHLDQVTARLRRAGLDPDAAGASGQLSTLDAETARRELGGRDRIDPDRFDDVVGSVVSSASRRWERVRVFGEVVDLFWRRREGRLALQLEDRWNDLLATSPLALLCGYESVPGHRTEGICDRHDTVLAA